MQVFKSYFKILRRYVGQVLMWLGIFIGMMMIILNVSSEEKTEYTDKQCLFACVDHDGSDISKELTAYLSEHHERVAGIDEDKESVQDALYNRNIHCYLVIPEGFGEAVKAGNADGMLKLMTIPGTDTASLFEGDMNGFMQKLSTLMAAGYDEGEAADIIGDSLKVHAEVKLKGNKSYFSKQERLYSYIPWILLMQLVNVITPILMIYNKKELRNRIECSSYKYVNINKELLLAVIITGLGVCVPYVMMDGIMLRDNLLTVQSSLYMANMLVYMLVAVNIAFLFSKVAANDQVVSMLSNIVGLGMAFLSGVFVPMQYLGAGVIRVAHFLPAYWYVIACENIYKNGSGKLGVTLQAMGVQVLFAVAIFMITLVVGKNKKSIQN